MEMRRAGGGRNGQLRDFGCVADTDCVREESWELLSLYFSLTS